MSCYSWLCQKYLIYYFLSTIIKHFSVFSHITNDYVKHLNTQTLYLKGHFDKILGQNRFKLHWIQMVGKRLKKPSNIIIFNSLGENVSTRLPLAIKVRKSELESASYWLIVSSVGCLWLLTQCLQMAEGCTCNIYNTCSMFETFFMFYENASCTFKWTLCTYKLFNAAVYFFLCMHVCLYIMSIMDITNTFEDTSCYRTLHSEMNIVLFFV